MTAAVAIADSQSRQRRWATTQSRPSSSHILARMSPVIRDGIFVAQMCHEYASAITNTGI
ncbi:hypothetical protein G6026_16380 [Dietzia sp. DQ11-38-2]|uniref:hypothetical protein n=1 Tax=Dietzia sp. DQ11-38-2 TaxID=2711155 RepID=UPI0015FA7465|nr:hypothetical protein [Dietzia sp. DQ11-38-2]MBB1029200.1 hypothetical protein [Dietzia sp. DQ11-38-2]